MNASDDEVKRTATQVSGVERRDRGRRLRSTRPFLSSDSSVIGAVPAARTRTLRSAAIATRSPIGPPFKLDVEQDAARAGRGIGLPRAHGVEQIVARLGGASTAARPPNCVSAPRTVEPVRPGRER